MHYVINKQRVLTLFAIFILSLFMQAHADVAVCKTDADCKASESCTTVKTGCPGAEAYSTCASRQCVIRKTPAPVQETLKIITSPVSMGSCAPWDGLAVAVMIPITLESKDDTVAYINLWDPKTLDNLPRTFNFPDKSGHLGNTLLNPNIKNLTNPRYEKPTATVIITSYQPGKYVDGEIELVLSNGKIIKQHFHAPWSQDHPEICG